jgi:hypothetical protein
MTPEQHIELHMGGWVSKVIVYDSGSSFGVLECSVVVVVVLTISTAQSELLVVAVENERVAQGFSFS